MNTLQLRAKNTKKRGIVAMGEYLILELLNQTPLHPYKICKTLKKSYGDGISLQHIYYLLNNMQNNGFVSSEKRIINNRLRTVYHVTHEGVGLLNCHRSTIKVFLFNIGSVAN